MLIANGLIKEMVTLDTGIREITNDIAPVLGRLSTGPYSILSNRMFDVTDSISRLFDIASVFDVCW